MMTRIYIRGKAVFILLAILFAVWHLASIAGGARQHDFRIYYLAAEAHEQGLNPYVMESLRTVSGNDRLRLPFLYPPFSLFIFKSFAAFPYEQAYYIYLALKLIALAALLVVWMKILPVGRAERWALLVTAVLGYRHTIIRDLMTGNISIFEQLALWSGILCLLRQRAIAGSACIAASSLFKLATLALLPLVFLIRRSRQSLRTAACALAAMIAFFGLSFFAAPDQWADLLRAAAAIDERGFRNPSSLALCRDLADRLGLAREAALPMYGLLAAGVMGAMLWALRVGRASVDPYPVLYLVILGYCLMVPRLKDYSFIIALLPTLHILASMCQARWLIIAGCILLWIPIISYQPLITVAFAFLVVWRWIVAHRHQPEIRVPISIDPLRPLCFPSGGPIPT